MKRSLPIVSVNQLLNSREYDANYKHYEHMMTFQQAILMYSSLPLLAVGGLGFLTCIAGVIWFFRSNLYQIRNKDTRAMFMMKKADYYQFRMMGISQEQIKLSNQGLNNDPNTKHGKVKSKISAREQAQIDSAVNSVRSLAEIHAETQTMIKPQVPKPTRVATAVIRIAGTKYYRTNMRDAIATAQDMRWFDPFEGESAKDMKEYYQGYLRDDAVRHEFPRDLFENAVELNLEPDNPHDENAIVVQIRIYDDLFTVGHVSRSQLIRIHKYVDDPEFTTKYEVISEIFGGKSKWVEEIVDPHDYFSDSSKLDLNPL